MEFTFKDGIYLQIWNARITRTKLTENQKFIHKVLSVLIHVAACALIRSNTVSYIWASSRENLSSGFPTKRLSNQSLQLQRLARKLILLDKRITKVLISLRGWAGWSAPVLFPNPQRQVFSRQGLYVAEN